MQFYALLVKLKKSAERPLIVWAGGVTAVWALLATLFIGWVDTHLIASALIAGVPLWTADRKLRSVIAALGVLY